MHAIIEQGGCHPARIWSTSAMLNNYRLLQLSVEQDETGVALATLKAGYYSVQLQFTRLEREEELLRARTFAEQATVEVLRAANQERKKLEAEFGQLRVELATARSKVHAAEAVEVVFQENDPQIPNGPREISVEEHGLARAGISTR